MVLLNRLKNKKVKTLAAALVLLGVVPGSGHAQGNVQEPVFFSVLEDVPVMPGLMEVEDSALFFDKPQGRIVELSVDMSGVTREQILNFYLETLPQFGWGVVEENLFFRDGEYLELSFIQQDGQQVLKIMVKPSA